MAISVILTSKKTPTTAKPSGAAAASPNVAYFLAFQWTKWSFKEKRQVMMEAVKIMPVHMSQPKS